VTVESEHKLKKSTLYQYFKASDNWNELLNKHFVVCYNIN